MLGKEGTGKSLRRNLIKMDDRVERLTDLSVVEKINVRTVEGTKDRQTQRMA